MTFDFGVIKKHPLAIGGTIAVIGTVVFYLIVRKSSGNSADGSGATQEFLQTLSAQQAATAQYNAMLEGKQIDAQVASLQITKQAESYAGYLDTQENLATIQGSTQTGIAQIQSDTLLGAAGIQADLAKSQTEAQAAYMAKLESDLIPLIAKKYPGSSTGVTQIIAALEGQGPEALAYTNPGAYSGSGFNVNLPGLGSIGVGVGG